MKKVWLGLTFVAVLSSCGQQSAVLPTNSETVSATQLQKLSAESIAAGNGNARVQLYFTNGLAGLGQDASIGVRNIFLCGQSERCVRFGDVSRLPIGQLQNGLEVDFADSNTDLSSIRQIIVHHEEKLTSAGLKFESQSIRFNPPLNLRTDAPNTIFLKFEAGKNDDATVITQDAGQRVRATYLAGGSTANQRFFASIGGAASFDAFLAKNDAATIQAALAVFGMKYSSDAVVAPAADNIGVLASTDCVRNFSAADSGMWHTVDGGTYYVDSVGRPSIARRTIPPIKTGVRTTCQTTVGKYENATGYDGGHMIATQIGGYGTRINIVPQNLNFNRGNWAQIENKLAGCGSASTTSLEVTVAYPTTVVVTPNLFTYSITNGTNITKTFTNTDGGGTSGVSNKDQIVTFLTGKGCI